MGAGKDLLGEADKIQNRELRMPLTDPYGGSRSIPRPEPVSFLDNKETFLNQVRKDMGVLNQREDFKERVRRREERNRRLRNITLD